MFLVMPSDSTTTQAAQYLAEQGIPHQVMAIPLELGYKTAANTGIYLEGENTQQVMLDLSAKGFVIMRVFRGFKLESAP